MRHALRPKKKKPDLFLLLVVVVALGIIGTSVAQGLFADTPEPVAAADTTLEQAR
jgi:hypothetical protein